MRKNAKRILSVFLTALMLVVVVIPVHALPVPGTLYETTDFYNSIYTAFLKWKVDHPDSEYPGFHPGGIFGGGASRDELKQKYDAYVETLPAQGYTSAGRLTWQPTVSDLDLSLCKYYAPYSGGSLYTSDLSVLPFEKNTIRIVPLTSGNGLSFSYSTSNAASGFRSGFDFSFKVPISGSFGRLESPRYFSRWVVTDGSIKQTSGSYTSSSFSHFSAGENFSSLMSVVNAPSGLYITSFSFENYFPVFEVIPDTAISSDTYNINTRPTSITGGNYGIVGDNGQITKVEDNSTIINETNNTYYNPATGQTVPITGWNYDYSDRSYKVTLESGDTVTVTYGDENITIQEGDTIYNVYYLIDGTGSGNPPVACEHDWQKGEAMVPTCTIPGKASYVCSKCQQTKTEAIPALGHDWQMKQTVTTQYDETGQLVQEGYTIFECSRCHEQYKSTDGTIPPGGGSGTDPGGEDGETTIGGLIEKLLSGVGSIVGGIIKGLLSLLTKAVEALAGLAELFTTFVGSLVELWGGFTSFLSAVFPFLPEEFVIIIELGLILMIAAAVFRKFIS